MALSAAQQRLFDYYQSLPASARTSAAPGAQDPAAIARHLATLTDDEALGTLASITGQANGSTFRPDSVSTTAATPERRTWTGSPDNWIAHRADGTTYGPGTVKAQGAQTMQTTQAPSYTADQIRAEADRILNQGGSYEDVAKTAQQFGVPLNDVFSAYGMNQAQGQQFLIDQGLRDYIQPGTVDPSIINSTVQSYLQNPNLNDQQRSQALGSLASQYGVSNDQIAQATGYSLPQVQSYASLADLPQVGNGTAPTTPANPGNQTSVTVPPGYVPPASGNYPANVGIGVGSAPSGTTPANPMGTGQGTFSQQYGGYQASPWLSATADEIGRRTQQGLGQAFNGIRSNAIGVGGLGGSRQGVAEAQATSNAMDSLQGNLANLFGQDYTNSMNRGLQARGQDQSFTLGVGGLANQRRGIETGYDLGLGNQYLTGRGQDQNYSLGLGNQALTGRAQDLGFYSNQRSQDLQQLGLGAEVYDMGVRGGWMPLTTAGGLFNTTAGNSYTDSEGSRKGGGAMGLLGGLWGGAKFGKDMGWWG